MRQGSLTSWLSKASLGQDNASKPEKSDAGTLAAPSEPNAEDNVNKHEEEPYVPLLSSKSTSAKTTLASLPSNVELKGCTKRDVPSVKHLLSLLLPIPYPEKFYKEIIEDEVTNELTVLAFWREDSANVSSTSSRLVGVIRCRLLSNTAVSDVNADDRKAPLLYLSALAVLSPYRGHGIAAHLLQAVEMKGYDEYGVAMVGAHVWEANGEGLEWYRKRGFHEIGREDGYYRKLDPQTAVIMRRELKRRADGPS